MRKFTHLHVHTQYSILDGASDIGKMLDKAKDNGMEAIAITDHGNMFGVKKFHETATKKGIKPIIGCEMYIVNDRLVQDKNERGGTHLIVLAKSKKGYHNLIKLVTKGALEGQYYGKPRIDKKLLWEYSEDLIISTACIGGEIPQFILKDKPKEAEELILKYKEKFKDDFYLEMQRHETGDAAYDADLLAKQNKVNKAFIELSKKTGVKLIATNDCHFLNKEDASAHDILICLNTGKDVDDTNRMRYSGQEYVKTPDEMFNIFKDIPEAIENTNEIADKIENYELNRDVILPEYPMPEPFTDQDDYLRHLTYEGAKEQYEEITDEVTERLDMELGVIKDMGFAGYFLIVQDFLNAAREMDVSVGPGRGSAAGSAVAFSIRITDIDPIKYKLLFERFLNPERVSMPDIDIDFDEDGREDVMKWVVDKYGKDKVAQIITFGTMAAKMAIRDVARVLKLPLFEADKLAKLVPEGVKVTLKKAFDEEPELKLAKTDGEPLIKNTLNHAETLEGSIRQTGIHACGVIIGRDPLIEHIPLTKAKDSELDVTQYDGKYIEDVGMLKMDFLGLKTLSIIKDTIENVKLSRGIDIDMKKISLDDPKTFQLYQNGETIGTFQFESEGMRSHLRNLKPTNIEDLIAMNALYRPGPLEFIPTFIKRKQGVETVKYPHKMLEGILKDTYGIMVYQEQIMQTAQIMGGFSLGSADILRRAMGKKKMDIMEEQKVIFVEGAKKQGVDEKNATDVFDVMTEFAKYGFNRSHSAAYSLVAFHTAYLKANYPAEYMAAVLSRNLSDIKKITIFMDECKRMGLDVLGPDVNESHKKFTVNKKGAVRFGLAAIKGVGAAAVENIVVERIEKGAFKDIFDFVERVNISAVSKRNLEGLSLAGAFDSFSDIKRHQYFCTDIKGHTFVETLIRYGNSMQSESGGGETLFGGSTEYEVPKPDVPTGEEWSKLMRLNKEKELIGIYLSAHPLDDYKLEVTNYCNAKLSDFSDLKQLNGKEVKIAGIVTGVEHRTTKTGKPFGSLILEDYSDTYKFVMFSKDYLTYKQFFTEGYTLVVKGKVQKRFHGEELEFKITHIDMLSELKDKMISSIALKLQLSNINDTLISDIKKYTEKSKGNVTLKFLIYEPETKIWVQLFSRSHKVEVTNGFIDLLENNSQIEYKIY